jgi:alpha-tubulin suppressor-like RCC1 family protein
MYVRPLALALALAAVSAGCRDDADSPVAPAAEPVPPAATAGTLTLFRVVTAGGWHSCGVTTENRAYCWGLNSEGQLGDGTKTNRFRPVAVAGGLQFTALSASDFHTCGLATDSLVYCWGRNANGQLGDGTLIRRLKPVKVGSRHYKQVNTGGFHTCAVAADNQAYCWGKNSFGQLGDGTTTRRLTPIAVAGGYRFRGVSAGAAHTCAITAADNPYCWGDNTSGKLGIGTIDLRRLRPALVAGELSFLQLSAGNGHTCGLTTGQQAYCWGSNVDGQLGDGTRNDQALPHLVAGGRTYGQVKAAAAHSCGVSTDHKAFCWGDNFAGRLGDGTMADRRLVPTAVAGGLSFAGVDPGTSGSCAVTTLHRAYCWGHNAYGQLGIGTNVGPETCPFDIPCATKPQAVLGPS